jgi:hypothetical protein
MVVRFCEGCGSEIPFNPRKGIKNYENRKFCSLSCAHQHLPQSQKQVVSSNRLKPCSICGGTIPKPDNHNWNTYAKRRFCSMRCCGIAKSRKVAVPCTVCQKVVHRSPSQILVRVFCSKKCHDLRRECVCEVCKTLFLAPPCKHAGNHTYCSIRCSGIAKRRHLKPNQGRRSPEDRAWRAAVLARDKRTCQHCAGTRRLEAHHIIPIKDRPDLRHEVSNGLTLCHQCHFYGVHGGQPNFIHGRYSKRHQKNPSVLTPL